MTVQRERGCRNHPGRSSAKFPESVCTMLEAAIDRTPHYRFAADHPTEAGDGTARKAGAARATRDLAYTVELWDEAKASVEITLALTANGSMVSPRIMRQRGNFRTAISPCVTATVSSRAGTDQGIRTVARGEIAWNGSEPKTFTASP
jgi:hypothetical protein